VLKKAEFKHVDEIDPRLPTSNGKTVTGGS